MSGRQSLAHTQRIAEFLSQLRFEQLPASVVHDAKRSALDYLGVALVGSQRRHSRAARQLMLALDGAPTATILGSKVQTAVDRAAFLNGLSGSSGPNLDDAFKQSLGHPGVGTHPAVLATSELRDSTGKEAITAVVAGYELAMRVGAAIGADAFEKGWHPRGGCNFFAAAAATAKLLQFQDPSLYCAALGLAGNSASGLLAASYFHDAWYALSANASQAGVTSALLAEAGFSAGEAILEDEVYGGYCRAVASAPNLDHLTTDLGEEFKIANTYFKRHCSSATTHAALDATLYIISETNIAASDIARITVRGYKLLVERISSRYPESPLHASISLPYLIAVAICDRKVGVTQVSAERYRDKEVLALQDKIDVVVDPELEKLTPKYLPSTVEVLTHSGNRYSKTVTRPKGDPDNPLSDADLNSKFDDLTSHILMEGAIQEIKDAVWNLESLSSIRELTSMLRKGLRETPRAS